MLSIKRPTLMMAITIKAEERWNATGVMARKGATYRIEVAADETWTDWFIKLGPAGYINPVDPFGWLLRVKTAGPRKARYFTLIGTIGRTEAHAFIIGQGVSYTAEWDGEIFCFANDAPFA